MFLKFSRTVITMFRISVMADLREFWSHAISNFDAIVHLLASVAITSRKYIYLYIASRALRRSCVFVAAHVVARSLNCYVVNNTIKKLIG